MDLHARLKINVVPEWILRPRTTRMNTQHNLILQKHQQLSV